MKTAAANVALDLSRALERITEQDVRIVSLTEQIERAESRARDAAVCSQQPPVVEPPEENLTAQLRKLREVKEISGDLHVRPCIPF